MTIPDILLAQDGVISRRQVLEAGDRPCDIRRRLRRREWKPVHPGVYVNHTGPPTWNQLAWAAVLFYWPAALEGASALHAHNVRGYEPRRGAPIRVCVDRTRTIRRRVGITVYQVARAESQCNMVLSPPRQSVEHALLSVASRKKRLDSCVATVADAVQDGRTTAKRLRSALADRPKLRHRALLRQLLGDVDEGVRSVLEYRYKKYVEHAHGLPRAERQQPWVLGGKKKYPDVEYEDQNVLVHLDGRVGHADSLDRWSDFEADLAGAIDRIVSVRIGWGQVLDPCRLAAAVGALLHQRGWTGRPFPCSPMCTAFETPDDSDVAQSD
ncbi:hypothetical protein [Nocardioides halotolerans]|uniref:hypothetical protein n=1 Tax=Nocardioides halotolerans TaxID=433660 RepID=UPI0012F98DFC|nr:hypothetical protein [Nocardioides halotolerans]